MLFFTVFIDISICKTNLLTKKYAKESKIMKEWSVVLFGHEYLMAARSYAEAVRQVWELFDECGIDPEKDCLAGADAGPIYDAPDPDDDDCLPPFDTSNPDFHWF